jgi:hypothetical protein
MKTQKYVCFFLISLVFSFGLNVRAEAPLVTPVVGGEDILLSTYNNEFLTLTDLVIKETEAGQIGSDASTFVLTLPDEFEFDVATKVAVSITNTKLDESGSCAGAGNRTLRLGTASTGVLTQQISPEQHQLTIHIKQASFGNCKGTLTVSGMRIKPLTRVNFEGFLGYTGTAILRDLAPEVTSFGVLKVIDDVEEVVLPVITLLGLSDVTLEAGSEYIDEGVTAVDGDNEDITDQVVVTGLPIDTSNVGNYEIEYNVSVFQGEKEIVAVPVKRTVRVIDTTPPTLTLVGTNPYEMFAGDTYIEAGATAIDLVDGDLTSAVEIVDMPDVNVVGEFEVVYKVSDTNGNTSEALRIVKIKEKVSVIDPPQPQPESTKRSSRGGSVPNTSKNVAIVPSASYSDSFVGLPSEPRVLGASTTNKCNIPIDMELVDAGDIEEITKLQDFLNQKLVLAIPLTGVMGDLTQMALEIFQLQFGCENF